MNSRQSRKYNAAVSGDQELTNHAADFAGNTALTNKQTALQGSIDRIEIVQQKQETDISGFAAAKFAARQFMAGKAWVIAKLLTVYAREISDSVLLEEIDFEKSDFMHGKETVAKDRAKLVRDRANTHLAAMMAAGYQITAAMITALSTAITNFEAEEGKPGAAEGDTVAATSDLATEFTALDTVEEDIFDLIVSYAENSPSFYNAVNDAFEIEDIGSRMIAMRVTAADDVTNTRLAKAAVRIVELNIVKNSSKRGVSDFSQLEMIEGNYTVEITLNGYQTFLLSNLAVFASKLTRVEARLVKL